MLRNHFEGTEHDPYTNGLNGKEPWRPISVFRTYEAHVMQVRPELPQEIGEVTYVGLGMADLTAFVPYYSGLEAYQNITVLELTRRIAILFIGNTVNYKHW